MNDTDESPAQMMTNEEHYLLQPSSSSSQQQQQQHFFANTRRNSSSSSNLYNNNNNNRRQQQQQSSFHRIQTEHSNLNHYKQPAPFQPASYHHNTNLIIDKYNRKYNLISFVLLRKFDNYVTEEKAYLNDQLLYNLVRECVQGGDLDALVRLFKENKGIGDYKNSYNSSFFVYTVREALDLARENPVFLESLIDYLFENELPTELCSLTDGDYPMRNILHYSAQHSSLDTLKKLYKHFPGENLEKLCTQTDYIGNTPLHLAVQHSSVEFFQHIYENSKAVFKQVNFDYAYNYEGFNLILLASRYASLELIKYLHETIGLSVNLKELNQNSLKTCLHLAVLRTIDKEQSYLNAFKIVQYFYEKNNYLAYELSPLVGSVCHIAAANLTRLHVLWYFLCEYNEKLDKSGVGEANLSVNSLDFRQYSCIDCFIDTLINIRSILPATETVYSFYKKYFYKLQPEDENFAIQEAFFHDEASFNLLIRKCLFKLIAKCKAKITRLPAIKSQLELLEFIRLLKFMSKFHFKLQTKFDSMYYTKFEAFCLKFLNTFIFTGDLLPLFVQPTAVDHHQTAAVDLNNNNTNTPAALNDTFLAIFSELIELTRIIVNSGFFTIKFQQKIYSFMCDYFTNLSQQYDNKYTSTPQQQQQQPVGLLRVYLSDLQKMNKKSAVMSLKDLCRYEINHCLFNNMNRTTTHDDAIYFSLPTKPMFINFLTFDLINDLFGPHFHIDENNDDEILRFI